MTYLGTYIPDHIRVTYRPKLKRTSRDPVDRRFADEELPPHVCKVCGKELHPSVMLPLCVEHDDITETGRPKRK